MSVHHRANLVSKLNDTALVPSTNPNGLCPWACPGGTMWVVMGFWDDLYSGFASSPTEIILLLVAIVLFVGLLVTVFAVRTYREKKERLEVAGKTFKQHADRRDLTWPEREALAAPAKHLHAPERKHLLVVSQGMFNSCARRALDEDEITEQQVSSLRVKLGFAGKQTDKPPKSTTELPAGAGLLIEAEGTEPVRARIREHRADFFEVQLDDDTRGFALDTPVTVVYQTNSDESPMLTHFVDAGGGGASIKNPDGSHWKGSGIELTFHPDSEQRLNLHGRVVRASRNGRVLHITFERLRESARDKIYRILFRRESS